MTDEDLFEKAKSLQGEKRSGFLAENAASESQLLRVEGLLEANNQQDSLLDLPSTEEVQQAPETNQSIGNYKLLQKIGEGGMGSVFMAEQLRPVKRVVALKVVKAGMDSKQVVARFEAERQSLAMMDHPNIAKVLDAGSTERGEPYFVMELVKGVLISRYCDDNRLSTEQRVRLMMDVCSAIQHAHQKGIIHRDLKPSNILVAQYDDRPVPKVIDFGVAKATHQKLTEKTLYTQLGQIVGTLEYMSPEQAVLNQLDVDTRTDVYSLGVILYELLVGETPLNAKELRSQGLEQILRTIREQEPPRPSLRLSNQGEAATQTAAYQKTDQSSLSRTLRGDLDWIVMKALEKDRSRRYDSASRLSEDLNSYLQGDAVEARPPTIGYRLMKAWRRNSIAIGSVSAVIIALASGLLGMAISLAQLNERNKELRAAKEELSGTLAILNSTISKFRRSLIERGIEAALNGDTQEAERIALEAKEAGAPDEWIYLVRGLAYQFEGDNPRARQLLADAYDAAPNNLGICCALKMAAVGDQGGFATRELGARMNEIERKLPDLQPSEEFSRYELLFLGWSQVYDDPTNALTTIEEVVASDKPWSFAQAMLAMCLFHEAYDTGDASYAIQALSKIREFEGSSSDSPFIMFVGLHSRFAAYLFARQSINEGRVLSEMRKIAGAMADYPTGWAADSRFAFYELIDSPETPSQYAQARNDWWQCMRAAVMIRYDESWPKAQGVKDAITSPFRAVGEASALAIIGQSELARQIYRQLRELDAMHPLAASLEVPLLLGDLKTVETDSRRCLEKLETYPDHRNTILNNYTDRLKFLSGGQIDAYLQASKGSKTAECSAYYLVGLRLLAQRDPDYVFYLQECVKTKQIWLRQYHFSKTILLRNGFDVPAVFSPLAESAVTTGDELAP